MEESRGFKEEDNPGSLSDYFSKDCFPIEEWFPDELAYTADMLRDTAANLSVKPTVNKYPSQTHDIESDTLGVKRFGQQHCVWVTPHTSTRVIPFGLAYGHEAVLPLEVMVPSLRVTHQSQLSPPEFMEAMLAELEGLDETRVKALNSIMANKAAVARAYNKKVKGKAFKEGNTVWKMVLPISQKDRALGKWSHTWDGPYIIENVLRGGVYLLKDLSGDVAQEPISGKYLKQYFPPLWEVIRN
ncbi:uncharacterized protein LOC131217497 [Magnolia sinica]|uniref:uncharacterized protein LOC131217497 n=1 Tax=Magnolia sinica TaxID=86752 RepID=UPI002657D10B|nr:uncharacterized protein LOC131217497 [Magnolia sinica]